MPNACQKKSLQFFTIFGLVCLLFSGCGVLIGNPEDETGFATPDLTENSGAGDAPSSPPIEAGDDLIADIDDLLSDYLSSTLNQQDGGVDCGRVEPDAPTAELEAGRECVRMALEDCNPAKFYVAQITNEDSEGYVSFVRVKKMAEECTLRVRTISSDAALFLGDVETNCSTLGVDELPEFGCGIGPE